MTRSCLITGGAGFIGCALAPALLERFDRVFVVDSLISQVHKRQIRPLELDSRAEFLLGDVADPITWAETVGKTHFHTVVHLAAETGTGQSLTHSSLHAMTNIVGTTRMLDHFVASKTIPEVIVLASSRAVYGEGNWQDEATGDLVYPGQRDSSQLQAGNWDFINLKYHPSDSKVTIAKPVSVYGASKLAQETILSAWANAFNVRTRILRFQNVYGEGQSLSNPYTGIVGLFCRLAKEGKSIPLYEDGNMLRDFVHISDVTSAIVSCVELESAASLCLDIGTGRATTIGQIAQILADIYSAPPPHICGKHRLGDVRHASCENAAAKVILKWNPKISVEAGCARLANWIDKKLSEDSAQNV